MKSRFFTSKSAIFIFLCFHVGFNFVSAQNDDQNFYSEQNQIISQCLAHESLYAKSEIDISKIATFYVLDHGVDLNFTSDLKINDKSVALINKGDIGSLNGAPYFLFHTLNIEDSKAFARVYLTYTDNGETKTSNVDILFMKNSGQWQIANK